MRTYKRNQVEEAIGKVFELGRHQPSPELGSRIKRLLETDRTLAREGITDGSTAGFAFFSSEPLGSGREIWFSDYEAFALTIGLELMRHGWPQSFSVKVLREVRSELESAYSITLAQDAKWLFDQEAIRRKAQEGDLAFNNQDPFLLTIVSARPGAGENRGEAIACGVKRGASEASRFANQSLGKAGGGWTMFDVVGIAHAVSAALTHTKPRSRGRP